MFFFKINWSKFHTIRDIQIRVFTILDACKISGYVQKIYFESNEAENHVTPNFDYRCLFFLQKIEFEKFKCLEFLTIPNPFYVPTQSNIENEKIQRLDMNTFNVIAYCLKNSEMFKAVSFNVSTFFVAPILSYFKKPFF